MSCGCEWYWCSMSRLDAMERTPEHPSIYTVHYPSMKSRGQTTPLRGSAEHRHRSVLSKPLDAHKNSGLGWKEGQMQGAKAARADNAGQSSLEEGQRHFDLILPSISGDAGRRRRMAVGRRTGPRLAPAAQARTKSGSKPSSSKIRIVPNLIKAALALR